MISQEALNRIYDKANNFLVELKRLWLEFQKERQKSLRISPEQGIFCGLFVKSFKTGRAILTLCREGFGEDAVALSRILFESVVMAKWIIQEDSHNRGERYVDIVAFNQLHEIRRMIRAVIQEAILKEEPLDKDFYRQLASDRTKKLRQIKIGKLESKHGFTIRKSNNLNPCGVFGRAQSVGLLRFYGGFYPIASSYVHSDARTLEHYVLRTPYGVNFTDDPNWNLVIQSLLYSFKPLYELGITFNSHFSLGRQQELEKHWTEMEALITNDIFANTD